MELAFSLILLITLTFIGELINGQTSNKEEIDALNIYQDTENEDWVDPLDIFNYDRSTKSAYKNTRKNSECDSHQCEEKLELCEAQIEKLTQTQSSVQKIIQPVPSSSEKKVPIQDGCMQSVVYMRRFVNILLRAAKLDEEMPIDLDVDLRMYVSMDQLKTLQLFSSGSSSISLQELESVLSAVLFTARKSIYTPAIPWSAIFEFLMSKQVLVTLALGLVPMLIWRMLIGHSIIRSLFIFLMIVFMMSFVITYLQMYKQEEIKQYAILKKNPNVPVECRPTSELSWLQMFERFVSSKLSYKSDECEKYYEAVMMDPFLKVTPTTVLSEMIGTFILHPSEMLGNAIAKFSSGILGNLPFGTNYLVLLVSFMAIILIVVISCGGIVKLPFYLGGIELRGRRAVPTITGTSEPQRPLVEAKQEVSEADTLNKVMKALGSSEHGFFITNVRGIEILSRGNSRVNESIESAEVEQPHTPGCCGESRTQCRHSVVNPVSSDEFVPICQTQPKKNRTEEIRMEKLKSPKPQNLAVEGTSESSSSFETSTNIVQSCKSLLDKDARTSGSQEGDKTSITGKVNSFHSDERVQTLDPGDNDLCSNSSYLSENHRDMLPQVSKCRDDVVVPDVSSQVSECKDDSKSMNEDCDNFDFVKL